MRVGDAWGRAFGCDLRSLAALRIALGGLLLAGLAYRLPEFRDFYTDAGFWPLPAARAQAVAAWPLLWQTGAAWSAVLVFSLSALAALALLVGWWTRVATIFSWVLLLCLQERNSLLLNGGDALLRLLLFWGMFLPLGARWSLDARRRPARREVLISAGAVALLLQVALVYFFNALYKRDASWGANGTAVEETLRLETYATPLGHALLAYPALLRGITHFVWWLELLGPWLAFVPLRHGWFRVAAAALFMGFHLALFGGIRIGLFPLVGMAAWLPFLPPEVWDFRKKDRREPPPLATQPVAVQAPVAAAFQIVMVWNLHGYASGAVPKPLWTANEWPGRALRLDQKWTLFAPPLKREGWYVAVLECSDGEEYDAFTGQEVDWARPASLAESMRSVNWRKFLYELRTGECARAAWLCEGLRRRWEEQHPGMPVRRVRLHFLWEWTKQRQNPPGNQLVFEQPPGPMTEEFRRLNAHTAEPAEKADN